MVKQILTGILIGIANIIPGVSGGTMAVSMGIYDKLIHSITHLKSEFKESLKFLIPILIGAGISIIAVARVIEYLFQNYPLQTNLLFIGLIIGGLPSIFKKVKGAPFKISNMIAFLLFFVIVVGSALIGEKSGTYAQLSVNPLQMVQMFGVGVIASATMVIPGVSGSMILMLMGYYQPVIDEINTFMNALVAFDMQGIINGIGILAPFGIGVVVGIFAIAKLIEIIFEKYPMLAYFAIIGLIVASPIAILCLATITNLTVVSVVTGLIACAAGALVAYKLGGE